MGMPRGLRQLDKHQISLLGWCEVREAWRRLVGIIS